MRKTHYSLILVLFCLTLGSSSVAQAQTTPSLSDFDISTFTGDASGLSLPAKLPQIKEQYSVDIFPENPKSNQDVTISAATYGIDINTQLVIWTVNGVEKLRGIGEKKFTFKTGNAGTVTTVKMTIAPSNAPRIEETFTFSPIDVDILWQANTYTPPFYKGKAMYTPEANVTFVAMPNILIGGRKVDPTDVVYTWKIDRKIQPKDSGFGRNAFNYNGPIILKPNLIQAEVYSASNKEAKGMSGITLKPQNPQAWVYVDNPLLGVLFNKAIQSQYYMTSSEVKFAVFPYFHSTENKNVSAVYSWNLDDAILDIPANQNSAIFRKSDNKPGSSFVSVVIKNSSKLLQKSGFGFNVLYGDVNSQ